MTTATAVHQQTFCGARLIPIVCNVPDVCPLPAVRLRPRDLEPKRAYKPELSTDCDRWHSVSTAPLRAPTYHLQFSPDAHSSEKIRCGAFIPARCSPFVRWGMWHAHLLWQAGTQPAPDWHVSLPVNICEKPAPIVYEPKIPLTKEEEEQSLKEWEARAPADLLRFGEIRGLKYEPPKKRDKSKVKRVRDPWSQKESWKRAKSHSDDEDLTNNGLLFDHNIDATRQTTEPSPTKLLDHSDLQAVRKLAKAKDPGFPIEIILRNKPIVEAAGETGITENALRKRVTNYFEEAIMYSNIFNGSIPYDLIKKQLTDEQLEAVRDDKAVFILLRLNDEWVWKQLDVETHGTIRAAINAFRVKAESNALDRKPGWKKSNDSKQLQTQAIKEVKARYNETFAKAFVLSNRPAWRGILGQLTQDD